MSNSMPFTGIANMRVSPQKRLTNNTIVEEGQEFHITSGYDSEGGCQRSIQLRALKPIDLVAQLELTVQDREAVCQAFREHWGADEDVNRFWYYKFKVIPDLLCKRLLDSGTAELTLPVPPLIFHVDEYYKLD